MRGSVKTWLIEQQWLHLLDVCTNKKNITINEMPMEHPKYSIVYGSSVDISIILVQLTAYSSGGYRSAAPLPATH